LPFEVALAFPVHPFWPTSNELEVVGEALSSVKRNVCMYKTPWTSHSASWVRFAKLSYFCCWMINW